MAFTKITNTELNSRGCTTLPNQPMISAQALKQEFDAPAKEIVAPKFNNLIDELEATTAAASIGVVAPTGRTGNTVQALLNDISADIGEAVADAHTHDNKALLDTYDQTNEDLADAVTKKHSHSNKDLLDTYTQSNSDLADAVSKKHEHSNKALLDTYTQTEADLASAVADDHTHSNKTVLDKFGENSSGKPTYDGDIIGGDISVKADKVSGATSGNFAGLDSNGNLTDSGSKASDFLTQHQDITGKADKVSSATSGNFAGLDSNGNLTDSGKKASDFLTSTDLTSYYTKTEVDAVTGDLTDLTTTAKNNLVAAINEAAASGGGLSDAFQKVKSGVTTLTASGADTLELKAGSNVTLTPDASDNSITISASGGGQSTGDMLAADYDSSYNVKNAGGIPGYVSTAISGKADSSSLATVATSGSYNDLSNKPTIPDVSGKADKVSGATSGNFASLDANGNLTDSGSKASDFKAANAHDAWSDVTSKPFSSVNSGIFDVVNDELRTTQGMVTGIYRSSDDGSASSSGYRAVGFWYLDNTGSLAAYKSNVFEVMKQTATATSYTFTNTPTNTNKMIDVYSSIYGEVPTSVTTPTDTSVTVTFAESKSRTVAITLI